MTKLIVSLCILIPFMVLCCGHMKSIDPVRTEAVSSTMGEYDYKGILDPNMIAAEWEKVTAVPVGPGLFEVYFKNPKNDELIPYATLIVHAFTRGCIGYSYYYNGTVYVFEYKEETDCFEPYEMDDESQKAWLDDYKTYFELNNT